MKETLSFSKKAARKRKKARASTGSSTRYVVDANGKRVAILLDMDEYRKLVAGPQSKRVSKMRLPTKRAELAKLARQAKGSWKGSEGEGTAVEIVRRLRDEWR